MGWAKYDEDNREAIEERWAMRDMGRPTVSFSTDYTWRKLNATKHAVPMVLEQKAKATNNYYGVR